MASVPASGFESEPMAESESVPATGLASGSQSSASALARSESAPTTAPASGRDSGSGSPLLGGSESALETAPASARESPETFKAFTTFMRAKLERDLEAFSEWSQIRNALGLGQFARISPRSVSDSDSDLEYLPPTAMMQLNHVCRAIENGKGKRPWMGDDGSFWTCSRSRERTIRSNAPFLLAQATYEVTPKMGSRFKESAYMPNTPGLYETVMVGCFTVSVGPESNDHFDEESVLNKTYPKRVITYLCGHAPEVVVSGGNKANGPLHVVKGSQLVPDLKATRCVPDLSTPEAVREVLHIPIDIDIQGCASKSFLQTLCIPDKMTLGLGEFNIPSKRVSFDAIIEEQKLTGTYESNPALIIKGILVLQYMQDNWVADFITRFCTIRNPGIETPVIGAITKDFGATNKEAADLARGWIIYGTPETCVTVVGINPFGILDQDKDRILREANLSQYFSAGGDGFVIGFYDPTYPGIHGYFNAIRGVLPNIPILAISTYSSFLFKGIEIPAPLEEGEEVVDGLLQPKIKIALMMICY